MSNEFSTQEEQLEDVERVEEMYTELKQLRERAKELERLVPRWLRGDRVQRQVFMDDGTWDREGDACLGRSPVRTGVVIQIAWRGGRDTNELLEYAYCVEWDDGYIGKRWYLGHGLDPCSS